MHCSSTSALLPVRFESYKSRQRMGGFFDFTDQTNIMFLQVQTVLDRCAAQSAAGEGRCKELNDYIEHCTKVGSKPTNC